MYSFLFFFNDTATTEIYTLSLHDALPIYVRERAVHVHHIVDHQRVALMAAEHACRERPRGLEADRKSTRLNSSHSQISYAVFCLKKKNRNYGVSSVTHMHTWHSSPTSPSI